MIFVLNKYMFIFSKYLLIFKIIFIQIFIKIFFSVKYDNFLRVKKELIFLILNFFLMSMIFDDPNEMSVTRSEN